MLAALLRRRDTGGRADGHRIALVIAGGGMRGAYAGGMAHALSDAGLAGEFDVVYGSSAGAYIGAALLVGHGEGAARIFFEDMASPAFIDLRRLRRRRHVVSLDHLIDHILVETKPLPWGLLSELPVPLHVVRHGGGRHERTCASAAHGRRVAARHAGHLVDPVSRGQTGGPARPPLDRRVGVGTGAAAASVGGRQYACAGVDEPGCPAGPPHRPEPQARSVDAGRRAARSRSGRNRPGRSTARTDPADPRRPRASQPRPAPRVGGSSGP